MKNFYYERGHIALTALTVAEMREMLAAYPDDMPVLCTWEETRNAVGLSPSLGVYKHYKDGVIEKVACLILDAE